jgi:hypothetical protein
MVARDGLEPPTPAFSGLTNQQLTDARSFVIKEIAKIAIGLHVDAKNAALARLDSGKFTAGLWTERSLD